MSFNKVSLSLFVLALTLTFTGCATHDSSHDPTKVGMDQLEPYTCGDVQRLHTFQGIFLASQPGAEDFAQAKKGGIETVVNMRHHAEQKDFNEKKTVEELGMNYFNPAWNGVDELTDAKFDEVRNILKTQKKPILLHCGSANRVGAIWLAYRVLDDGLSFDKALAEAKTVGLKTPAFITRAKAYIEKNKK